MNEVDSMATKIVEQMIKATEALRNDPQKLKEFQEREAKRQADGVSYPIPENVGLPKGFNKK